VLGDKAGGIFSMISQFVPMFAQLLGGGGGGGLPIPGLGGASVGVGSMKMPTHLTSSFHLGKLPGFASGGSGVFGGRPGVDKNVLSMNGSPIMRVSRGEAFSVSPAANSGDVNITQHYSFEGVALTQQEFVSGLLATKADTVRTIKEMQRRA
jgi:hypothetical protein